jgi:RND family efflux transporter MFP subunit
MPRFRALLRLCPVLLTVPWLLAAGPPAADPLKDIAAPAGQNWHEIRAQIVARVETTIGAPMTGRLVDFPWHDGERFANGAVLARFYCAEQEATLARAKAVLQQKREVLSTSAKLNKLGTSSGLEYRIAVAQVDEAAADVQLGTVGVENCVVKAPFAGRVGAVTARPFQSIGVGAPLLELLDDSSLEMELLVPSRWVIWLAPGLTFPVVVDETGKRYAAAITRVAGKVDAVSQSVKVYARLQDGSGDLRPGMSGQALLAAPNEAKP